MSPLGFIGTGVMGNSMAGHLLKAGYPLRVYTRTRAKAEPLLRQGAVWTENPAEAARHSEIVLTMVGHPSDVRSVYLEADGILAGMKPGGMVIDMTTSSPSLAREIFGKAAEKEISALDAPVSGGDIGAREARLSIMVGGDRGAFDRAKPILEKLGKNIVHQGPAGLGQHCKLVNQIAIAGVMIGMVEALVYARKSGLDPQTVLSTISQGAAGSWSLSNLAPRILRKDLNPGFMIEHFVKDMGLALEECRRMGIQLRGLDLAHQLYESLLKKGHGRKGTQALILALEDMPL
ncbi:MAG: NAD(P)-dependent oxidoreductase [Verrucomicrobia bacterium]|nr:NAD(P)-dependent oxidoreductase [Verrucomicrobiota bacterium]